MALVVRLVKRHHLGVPDLYEHRLVCDYCGENIEDAHSANALWWPHDMEYGATAPIVTVHKACNRAFEATRPGLWYWEELPVYLQGVLDNAGVNADRARRRGAITRALGESA